MFEPAETVPRRSTWMVVVQPKLLLLSLCPICHFYGGVRHSSCLAPDREYFTASVRICTPLGFAACNLAKQWWRHL